MTDASALVLQARRDAVIEITLNRPDKLNSMTDAMRSQLRAVLDAASNDLAIRAILLTGAGRGFCAGEDLVEVSGPDGGPDRFREIVEQFNSLVFLIRESKKPVIAAVNGVAAGAGANLALACDFVVASDAASFVQSFVHIGLVPDTGGSYFLPRLVGMAKARELLMLGEKVTATEAAAIGLIYRAVPAAALLDEARTLAHRLSVMPTFALALTKKLIDQSASHSLGQQLTLEKEFQVDASASADYAEGLRAFLEKRKAVFQGN